ncbi:hypothetical protein GBAR_LOCUS19214 [Geodia barretti]|nr:hypothetical protein GBAR_LOCUS19214 [Geodia barretti]
MLTASIIGEVLCASYIDKKHRMARPQFTVDTDWSYAYEEKDVVVLRKEFPDSPFHCWMGRTIIQRPMREIADFLQDPASVPIYDKHIVESKHIKVLSESETHKDVIAYYLAEARECLVTAKRDFSFFVRHTHFDDKYVMTVLSVDHPECPPLDGVPRAQLLEGSGWHLERHMGSNSRTLVTYIVHTDLKELPPIIANRVLKRQPLNAYYVKSHLMKLHLQEEQLSATFYLPLPIPQSHEDSQKSYSYSGRHFEEQLSVRAFTSRQTEIVNRGAVTLPQNDSSQSCWDSTQVSSHSHSHEDNNDTEPRMQDHQPATDPGFTDSD